MSEMFCEKKDREKMRLASHTLEDPAGGVVRGLIDDLDELEAALSAARAEVERLSRMEAAAKAHLEWYEERRGSGMVDDNVRFNFIRILSGLGPDGRPVGLDMAAKEKAAEETLACQLGGKVKP